MTCLVLGDSIAVGTHQALDLKGLHCSVRAKVGISSRLIEKYPVINADVVVISAGSNDDPNKDNSASFDRIRMKYLSKRVIWILPRNRTLASQVKRVAAKYRDGVVDTVQLPSRDNLHPRNYGELANLVKGAI